MKKINKENIKKELKPVDPKAFTGLGLAAYVLMIIVTVVTAFALIPMA